MTEMPCIECYRCPTQDGYARLRWRGREWYAHRLIFWLEFRVSPEVVRHSCDNPSCIEPTHLLGGTQYDNVQDRVRRGRNNAAFGEDAGPARLTEADVLAIRAASARGETAIALAERYGVCRATIGKVVRRASWTHI